MNHSIPLSMMSPSESGEVVAVEAGISLKKRLNDLGLYIGAIVKVVKNDFRGPVIVKILKSKIVLGRGQCQKILINPKQP